MARQKIELASEEAEKLSRRARATTVSVRDRRRAEIIVLSAQGLTQQRIAEQLGISRVAVNRWVGRFALQRLDGLNDRAGLIADNYAPHKHPAVTRWLDRHARFHMHYTPTSQQQK
jgi:transposase